MNHFPFSIPFGPRFYRNERINFWTICVDNRSASLPAKKKMENLVAFYLWLVQLNPVTFSRTQKKTTIWVWRKIFTYISVFPYAF